MNPPDDRERQKNPFPSEYEHVHEWVVETETRINQLDAELNTRNRGPQPVLAPPNYWGQDRPAPQRAKEEIQREKDDLKAATYQRVEKETEPAGREIRQQVRDTAFVKIYAQEIRDIEATERGVSEPQKGWELNSSHIKAHYKSVKERQNQPSKQPDKSDTFTFDEMSERYMKALDLTDPGEDPNLSPTKERDAPEWER